MIFTNIKHPLCTFILYIVDIKIKEYFVHKDVSPSYGREMVIHL